MTSDKLPAPKPCPFCGASVKQLQQDIKTGKFYMRCSACQVNGPLGNSLTGAVWAWNTRVTPPAEDTRRSWLRRGIGARPNEG